MHRLSLLLLTLLFVGCGADSGKNSGGNSTATKSQSTTSPATRPTSRPVVRTWKPMPVTDNEVNIIVIGDWGNNKETQKKTAATMATYVEKTGRPFNATLLAGDNFYVRLSGVLDYQWQSLFEDMYDAKKLAMPFYVSLGNHDYEQNKAQIERDYARRNP